MKTTLRSAVTALSVQGHELWVPKPCRAESGDGEQISTEQ